MATPTPEDVKKTLHGTFLFASLSEEQISALADQVWLERIPAGSLIVREGDEADALYVVVDGGVNVTKANGQFLAFLGPGGLFGEMALFMDGARRSATCESTKDTTCAVIRKPVLDQFCTDRPDAGLVIYRAIIRSLAERLQATSADLAFLMSSQVRKQGAVSKIVDAAKRRTRGGGSNQP